MAVERILHHPGDAVGEKVRRRAEKETAGNSSALKPKLKEVENDRLDFYSFNGCSSKDLSILAFKLVFPFLQRRKYTYPAMTMTKSSWFHLSPR